MHLILKETKKWILKLSDAFIASTELQAKKVAYFSMEFAIDQALKIYSGGWIFGLVSHMRSVYNLKQDTIGIGILEIWLL